MINSKENYLAIDYVSIKKTAELLRAKGFWVSLGETAEILKKNQYWSAYCKKVGRA